MSQHDQNKSHQNINILEDINFGEGIDLDVGLAQLPSPPTNLSNSPTPRSTLLSISSRAVLALL